MSKETFPRTGNLSFVFRLFRDFGGMGKPEERSSYTGKLLSMTFVENSLEVPQYSLIEKVML